MSALPMMAATTTVLCVGFAVVFLVCRRLDNFGFVDVAWSYAFAGLVGFEAFASDGWLPRRVVLAVLVGAWSVRLGTHLLRRVAAHHPEEDARYVRLRHDWAANFTPKMFGFFQLQALSIAVLGAGFLVTTRNTAPRFHPLELAAVALWLVAIAGEALADAQLAAFKRDPARRGQICDQGLWRYSRHPNYFFEWLVWVSFAGFALPSPFGWIGLVGPAAILYLLLRVTGIPLAEAQSLRSKGEAYRRYQETTSVFVPLPPRKPRR